MADLQEQIEAVLGDPEAMRQISAMAQAITGKAPPAQPHPDPDSATDVDFVPVETPPPDAPGRDAPTEDGGDGPDLSGLFGMLGGDVDPKLLQTVLSLYGAYCEQDDDKVALLRSLRPFLRPERQEKMEKAIQIAKLSRVVRLAFRMLKDEGDADV